MLDDERAGAARSIARETAQRLAEPTRIDESRLAMSRQTSYPAVHRWQPDSLALGDVGMAVLAAGSAAQVPTVDWDRVAHGHLARAVAVRTSPLSLFEGAVGLAAAVSLQRSRGGGYRRLSRQLGSRLLPRMRAAAATATAAPQTVSSSWLDVVNGFAGWCAYLRSEEPSQSVTDTLSVVGHALTSALSHNSRHAPLPTPATELDDGQKEVAPHGYLDCGMAHGIAGVVATLALLKLDGQIAVPGLVDALHLGADWLDRQMAPSLHGVPVPRVVLLDRNGRPGAPVEAGRPGWCYGAAGVARALWLAGQALGEETHRHHGLELLRGALRSIEASKLASPTICHGLAGLLLVATCFAWDGYESQLREPIADLVDRLLASYQSSTPLGFRDIENTGAQVDSAGFLSGAAGVALALLAVTDQRAPGWVRLLVLA